MSNRSRPKRPLMTVLGNFYQVLAANSSLSQVTWQKGIAEHEASANPVLRLATWNIFKANSGPQFFEEFAKLVQRTDILLLQEVLTTQPDLKNFVPKGWHGIHSGSYERRDGKREGVLSVSRYTQKEALRLLAPRQEPFVKTPKVGLASTVLIAGKPVHLVNLHLPLLRTAKQSQADLSTMLADIGKLTGPIIVAGDFNSFHRGYLRSMQAVLADIGLEHVVIPRDPRPTLAQLDHIFCRGLKVRLIRVANSYTSSDHFPIICELILKSSG